jgi:hypothetical protein
MKISPITKTQFISIVENTLLSFVATFSAVLLTTAEPFTTTALKAALVAAVMAALKTGQKLLTQG